MALPPDQSQDDITFLQEQIKSLQYDRSIRDERIDELDIKLAKRNEKIVALYEEVDALKLASSSNADRFEKAEQHIKSLHDMISQAVTPAVNQAVNQAVTQAVTHAVDQAITCWNTKLDEMFDNVSDEDKSRTASVDLETHPKASQPDQPGGSTHQAESLPKSSSPVIESNKPPVKAESPFRGKPERDSKPSKGPSTPPLDETSADSSTGLSGNWVKTPPLEDSPPRSGNRHPMMSIPGRSKPPPKQASGAPLQLRAHMPRQPKKANKPEIGQSYAQSGKAEGQDTRQLTSATQGKARSKEPSKTYATAAVLPPPPPPPKTDNSRWGQVCPPEYLAMLARIHKESQSDEREQSLFEAPMNEVKKGKEGGGKGGEEGGEEGGKDRG